MNSKDLLWHDHIERYRERRRLLDPMDTRVPEGKLIPLRQERATRIRRLPWIALGLAVAAGLVARWAHAEPNQQWSVTTGTTTQGVTTSSTPYCICSAVPPTERCAVSAFPVSGMTMDPEQPVLDFRPDDACIAALAKRYCKCK